MANHYTTVLSIAGSDSIGGAGIQADIKTCSALGVYAMTIITAVTAQNTCGVDFFEAVSARMLEGQLDSVLRDVCPDAVKIGMLPDVESIRIVARSIQRHHMKNVVLDPVCVATSGDKLSSDDVPGALCQLLFPSVTVVTPNMPEASAILGTDVNDSNSEQSARIIGEQFGVKAVLLKGGHSDGEKSRDILYQQDRESISVFEAPRITSVNTHGTGCTFSTAIACFLAKGYELNKAVQAAKRVITNFIEAGKDFEFGHGHGPVNHIATL